MTRAFRRRFIFDRASAEMNDYLILLSMLLGASVWYTVFHCNEQVFTAHRKGRQRDLGWVRFTKKTVSGKKRLNHALIIWSLRSHAFHQSVRLGELRLLLKARDRV